MENAFSSALSPFRRTSFDCVNQNSIKQKKGTIISSARVKHRNSSCIYRSQAILEERGWFNFPGNRVSLISFITAIECTHAETGCQVQHRLYWWRCILGRRSFFLSPPPPMFLFLVISATRIRSQVLYVSRSPLFLSRSSLFNVARLAKNAALTQHTADAVGALLYRRLFLIAQLLSHPGVHTFPTENTGYRHIHIFIGPVGATLRTEIPRSCFFHQSTMKISMFRNAFNVRKY